MEASGIDLKTKVGGATTGVVVPCHNYGRFLTEAIESVMEQTRAPDEVVIVDDGSTDDTSTVVKELQVRYPSVKVITHVEPKGAPAAFHAGYRRYFFHVCHGSVRRRPTFSLLRRKQFPRPRRWPRRRTNEGFPVWRQNRRMANSAVGPAGSFRDNPHHGSMMFRRSTYDRVGGFRGLEFEDWDLWLRMAATGATAGEANECVLEYRQHGPSRNSKSVWRARRGRFALLVCNVRVLGIRTVVSAIIRKLL